MEVGTLPDRIDIVHLAGAGFELNVPVLEADNTAMAYSAVAAARAQVRATIDGDEVLFVFATTNSPPDALIINSGGAAVVRLEASSETTSEWQTLWPGSAGQARVWWDLEITDTEGHPHQITQPGLITLIHQVTR